MLLKGHDGPVETAAFSSDSRTIVSAGNDGTVRWWNAATGQLRRAVVEASIRRWIASLSALTAKRSFLPTARHCSSGCGDRPTTVFASSWEFRQDIERRGQPRQQDDSLRRQSGLPAIVGRSRCLGRPGVCAKLVRNLSRAEWKQYAGDISDQKQCPELPVPSD